MWENLQLCSVLYFIANIHCSESKCFKFHRCDSAFLAGVTLMLFACVVWMKLVSYAHTSYDMRQLAESVDKVWLVYSLLWIQKIWFIPRGNVQLFYLNDGTLAGILLIWGMSQLWSLSFYVFKWFQGENSDINYSYDVSFKSLAYFMVAPTLCYQVGSVNPSEVVVTDFIPVRVFTTTALQISVLCFSRFTKISFR